MGEFKLLGFSRAAMAQRLGADEQMIAGYEHGECEVPAMMMARIAEILNKPLPWFFHRPAQAEQPTAPMARAAPVDRRLRVLLVDDAPDVLLILGAFLEGSGLFVIKAASGDEALRVVASNTVLHAIVTDSVMPGLSGADLLMQTAQLRPSLPGLIVTGYAEDLKRFGDLPKTVGVLRKPFRREQLVQRVFDMARMPNPSIDASQPASQVRQSADDDRSSR
jgi:CheY-like chemotaxis protein